MIRVQNLTRYYGDFAALDGASFELREGEIVGLLGLNGAGKSTTMKILAGLMMPSSGSVAIDDHDLLADPDAVRASIGFLPEEPPLYRDMTVTSFLVHAGRIKGMSPADVQARLPSVIQACDLQGREDQLIGTLSHGYKKRVGIAQAIIHKPRLIILDEPLQGCDPLARTTIMNVIRELGRMGRTVLLSSHILSEIERITEQIVILHQGRLLAIGNLHAIREQLDNIPHTIEIECKDAKALAKDVLSLDVVHGLQFPSPTKLKIFTHHLGEFHKRLPRIIVDNEHDVMVINNPDDDLQSILGYLTGGFR